MVSSEHDRLGGPQITRYYKKVLDAVTTATSPTGKDLALFIRKTFLFNVTVNTGAVTCTVQSSADNTIWLDEFSKTSTATVEKFDFSSDKPRKFWRMITTTQSASTVTGEIEGRS